jgi:hypothetical protein
MSGGQQVRLISDRELRHGRRFELPIDDREAVVALDHQHEMTSSSRFRDRSGCSLLVAGRATLLLVLLEDGFDHGNLPPIVFRFLRFTG